MASASFSVVVFLFLSIYALGSPALTDDDIQVVGVGLGYWGVRKFVLSSDGSVDIGVSQFVKWAIRVVGVLFVFESSYDIPLALAAVVSSLSLCLIISSKAWRSQARSANLSLWHTRGKSTSPYQNRAEFLSRPSKLSSGARKM